MNKLLLALGLASFASVAAAAPGDPVAAPLPLNTVTAGDQEFPAVAHAASGASVACWDSDDGSLTGVFARRIGADGVPIGHEFRVNTTTSDRQGACDVSMAADGRFVVVWRGSQQDGSGSGIYGQRFDPDGRRVGGEFQVNVHTKDAQGEPKVAMDAAGEFVVAWSERALVVDAGSLDRRTICARAFKANGKARSGDQLNVYTDFGPRVLTPGVSIADDASFVVVYYRDASPNQIFARRFLPTGLAVGPIFKVAQAPKGMLYDLPAVGMNAAGDFTVVWEATFPDGSRAGLYGRRYAAQGFVPSAPVITVPTVPLLSRVPSAGGAMPVIPPLPPLPTVTVSNLQGALGPPFRIDADDHLLGRASVAMRADRGFAVAADADGDGIFVRRFADDGTPEGDAARADLGGYSPLYGRISREGAGRYAVTWQSFGQDGSGRGVNLRAFEADTSP